VRGVAEAPGGSSILEDGRKVAVHVVSFRLHDAIPFEEVSQ
jgi:hypothetical protein